jgi:hypothetical protein
MPQHCGLSPSPASALLSWHDSPEIAYTYPCGKVPCTQHICSSRGGKANLVTGEKLITLSLTTSSRFGRTLGEKKYTYLVARPFSRISFGQLWSFRVKHQIGLKKVKARRISPLSLTTLPDLKNSSRKMRISSL